MYLFLICYYSMFSLSFVCFILIIIILLYLFVVYLYLFVYRCYYTCLFLLVYSICLLIYLCYLYYCYYKFFSAPAAHKRGGRWSTGWGTSISCTRPLKGSRAKQTNILINIRHSKDNVKKQGAKNKQITNKRKQHTETSM